MTQQHFIQRRESFWKDFENLLTGSRRDLRSRAAGFPQAFRELTQDLNTARAHGFDPAIIERLNRLVLEGNQILYGQHPFSVKQGADFILKTFPRAVRAEWRGVAVAHLLFYGLGLFIFLACLRFPGTVYSVLSMREAGEMERMYDPDSEYYLTPREVSSDADMFGYYIFNNISIAFQTFGGGILAGFGSLLFLCSNGAVLGAAAAHMVNRGFAETFFPFIIAHGAFELTAIVLSARAGLLLGYRLFITGGLSRGASIRLAGKTALPLIAGSAVFLLIAAGIEAFWSSRHELSLLVRYCAGAALWVLVIAYFVFAGREKRS